MSLIHEELKHEYLPVSLMVTERQKGESIAPWAIVLCEVDGMERMTPKELQELGHWLVAQGERIGREYKSNGTRKSAAMSAPTTQTQEPSND